jgi:predicted permease
MRRFRMWALRLLGIFAPNRRSDDFAQELESHLQMHIDDNLRMGMTPAEARRRAIVRLGGVAQAQERYRDQIGIPAFETLLQDVRGGVRLMWRAPSFTLIAILTLAIGIGANAVMFSVVNTVLLRPLPYKDPGQLLHVETIASTGQPWRTAPPDFYTYRTRNQTFDFLEAYYEGPANLTGAQGPDRVGALIVSAGFLDTLGVPPALGRGFVMGDEQWGSHRVVLLSDGLWKSRFGSDAALIGRRITINNEPYVVAGVMPPAFTFLDTAAEVIVPMAFEPGDNMNTHNNYFLTMIGRLKAEVTATTASADLNRISADIAVEHPITKGTSIRVSPLRDVLVQNVRRPVLVLLGAVAFVLLIACANLANLLLARGAVRQREIALRTAIGASRGRLLRQLLTESLVLATVGALAGLALAYFSIDALNVLSQNVLPRAEDIRIDRAVLAFTLLMGTATGVLFGLVPALRSSAVDVNEGLKESARTASAGVGTHRLRTALVVSEIALCLTLLIGAGLMLKSMSRLLNVPTGFDPEGVLTMQITLPAQQYVDRKLERQFSPLAYTKSTRFFADVIERVRSIPGVRAAGAISSLPLMGETWSKRITLFDRPLPSDLRGLMPIQYRVVSGDYFQAMGIRVLSGRAFTAPDTQEATKVAIVNRDLARQHWKDENPLGKIISVNPPLELMPENLVKEAREAGLPEDYAPTKLEVIGVVDDVRDSALGKAAVPVVYAPYSQGSEGAITMFLTVRTATDPLSVVGAVREQIRQVDANLPVSRIQTMKQRVDASIARPRLQTIVLGLFATIAIVLAVVGIYGVMSYSVAQRTREIGIRMALGARRLQVLSLVLRDAVAIVVAGLGVGVAASLLITRVLESLLFEVSTTDPIVFGAVAAALGLTGAVAALVPARRAARVDPVATLRSE